jgi:transcriptional regulator with XRE-family HTH domain
MDFSKERLNALLDDLDILNKELASLCGVAPNTVSRWLLGQTPVPHAVIRMLVLMRSANAVPMLRAMIPGDPDEMEPAT